ncbi:GerW family sporulation protein [Pallidibacillus pasinlerensis]|uniref:Sporulation protein YtfJ n=1 Tax=Pallidibacillus pasinlerensis TaxID=2703818 RepID=A0ABX0A0S2_9BACI|nr:GerW family sporulation protein [Pallidibacillus pasinlerensis]NCU17011.1 sporulation protein YtfJ [Pallidibacillus pasinlerensis]
MSEHPIQGLMTTAMENLKDMIDVNTIIGDPVETPDGSVIITVSKVGFGFAAGGSEFSIEQADQDLPFGGGSGGGVSITPIAFLIVNDKGVNLLHVDQNTHLVEKLMDTAPETIEKVKQMFSKNKNQHEQNPDEKSGEFPEYNI